MEQAVGSNNRFAAFSALLKREKKRSEALEQEAEPSLKEQIQSASDALERAREQFDAEVDFDRIDSHIYMMQALENRLNALFAEAGRKTADTGSAEGGREEMISVEVRIP